MTRRWSVLALVVAVMLVAVQTEAKTVKVGVILTFSGVGAEFGQQIERGYMLYAKQHEAQIAPHKVEIIKRDAKRPGGDVAKTLAQELITRDKVDILTGFVYSPNAIAIAPLATEGKTPVLIMNAGTSHIPSLSPYFTRVSFTMWQAGYAMGKYAAEKLGYKTAAVGYTNYPPGKDSVAAFQRGFEEGGGKVVDDIPMGGPAQVPDFTPFLQRVKDAKPQALYVFVPAGSHAAAVVKTYAALGMRQAGVALIGPGDITTDTKLQEMGDAAVGMITVHHYSADYDTPANQAFVKAWKAAYGADSAPDFMGVAGYDGMAAIFSVIKKLDGTLDPDQVLAALKGWKFDSPRGPIMIDPETRDIVQNQYVHEIVKVGNRLGVKVRETIPQVKDPCKVFKVGPCAN